MLDYAKLNKYTANIALSLMMDDWGLQSCRACRLLKSLVAAG